MNCFLEACNRSANTIIYLHFEMEAVIQVAPALSQHSGVTKHSDETSFSQVQIVTANTSTSYTSESDVPVNSLSQSSNIAGLLQRNHFHQHLNNNIMDTSTWLTGQQVPGILGFKNN